MILMDILIVIDKLCHHKIYTLTKRELYKNIFDVYIPQLSYYEKRRLLSKLLLSNVLIQTKRDKLLKFNKSLTTNDAIVKFE